MFGTMFRSMMTGSVAEPKGCTKPSHLDRIIYIESGAQEVRTADQAMRISAVYRCVDILSGTIASMPLQVGRKRAGIYLVDEEHELAQIFDGVANSRQTMYELMRNAIIQILLRGNAYILPQYAAGRIVELILLSPEAVYYDVYKNCYTVSDSINGIAGVYTASEIVHLRNKSLDGGYTGVSTIQYASRTLSLASNAEAQTNKGIISGNRRQGFISGGDVATGFGALQDKAVDDVAERLTEEMNSGRPIMRMPGGMTFQELSMSNADVEMLDLRKYSVYQICQFFGVHPDMVFVETSGNYKASENSQTTFLNQTLSPLLAMIEAELRAKLISRSVRTRYRIKFDLTALLNTDPNSRAQYIKTSIEAGVLTPNEARRLEGRSAVEGGDELFISCNVAPINSPKLRGQ